LRLQVKLEENPVDFLKLNENYEKKVSGDIVENLEDHLEHFRLENHKLQSKLESYEKDYINTDSIRKSLRNAENKINNLEKYIEKLQEEKEKRERE